MTIQPTIPATTHTSARPLTRFTRLQDYRFTKYQDYQGHQVTRLPGNKVTRLQNAFLQCMWPVSCHHFIPSLYHFKHPLLAAPRHRLHFPIYEWAELWTLSSLTTLPHTTALSKDSTEFEVVEFPPLPILPNLIYGLTPDQYTLNSSQTAPRLWWPLLYLH